MAVDLDEAFKRAVTAFYEKEDYFKNTDKMTGKPVKYNKKFFAVQEKHIRKINKKAISKAQQEKNEGPDLEDAADEGSE